MLRGLTSKLGLERLPATQISAIRRHQQSLDLRRSNRAEIPRGDCAKQRRQQPSRKAGKPSLILFFRRSETTKYLREFRIRMARSMADLRAVQRSPQTFLSLAALNDRFQTLSHVSAASRAFVREAPRRERKRPTYGKIQGAALPPREPLLRRAFARAGRMGDVPSKQRSLGIPSNSMALARRRRRRER